jgi:peptide/nickel transport system ATP-binding protein
LLFKLQKEMGMSILFITHNLGLVAQYAKRVAVMKEGKLVEENYANAVFKEAKHPYTRELISALRSLSKNH